MTAFLCLWLGLFCVPVTDPGAITLLVERGGKTYDMGPFATYCADPPQKNDTFGDPCFRYQTLEEHCNWSVGWVQRQTDGNARLIGCVREDRIESWQVPRPK